MKEDTRENKCNKMHNVFCDITLESTERKLDDVVADYHSLLPDTIPNIIGTVISVEGSGEEAMLKIAFPDRGVKGLMQKYAPICRAD